MSIHNAPNTGILGFAFLVISELAVFLSLTGMSVLAVSPFLAANPQLPPSISYDASLVPDRVLESVPESSKESELAAAGVYV